MAEQNFANHAKIDPLFHKTLFPILMLVFVGSLVNLYESIGDHERLYNASLVAAISFALLLIFFLLRIYPLKAQDRAIRAEENLRHYVLTGKLLDSRLTVKQIVALRFAPDAEFPALAAKAAAEAIEPKAIKAAIRNWRPDHDRL
jgi:hypothetical protein